MATAKRKDVLAGKELGEKYFALRFPENFQTWDLRKPWPTNEIIKFPIRFETIKVVPRTKAQVRTQRFGKKKSPLILKCGCDVVDGWVKTSQKVTASWTLKPDTVVDFNKGMTELSESFGFNLYDVVQVGMYNSTAGVLTMFEVFNPNGTTTALYTDRFIFDFGEFTYSQVPWERQIIATGGFCDHKEICEVGEKLVRVPKCGGKPVGMKPKPSKTKMTPWIQFS